MVEGMTTTPATPDPDAPTDVLTQEAAPTPKARRIPRGAPLIAAIVGGVLAVGMIFGGGVALGIALPIGDGAVTHQGGFRGDGPDGSDGPTRPGGTDRTNPNAPSAPNQNDTGTQDQSDEG
jgi:hypothetical protein